MRCDLQLVDLLAFSIFTYLLCPNHLIDSLPPNCPPQERGSGYGAPVDNISETVGNTPMVKINRLAPEGVTIFCKCEFANPLSSVKDRLALSIIETAEKEGKLKPGDTVIEATSGNTGEQSLLRISIRL